MRPTGIERFAALVALLTLAGAVLLLVVGVMANAGAVAVLVVGLVVAVIGAWYLVTRRGAVRSIAALVLLGGIGLLVGGFVVVDLKAVRIVGVAILGALSVGAARSALRLNDRNAPVHAAGIAGTDSVHPVLLINPKSGDGKAERFNLADESARRGIEPVVLQPGNDLLQVAEEAVARGAGVIGMAGGDGSQALVASVAVRLDVPHVVVPAGTRNHFALDLGLDRDDVVGALDAYDDWLEQRIDLASVNNRIFVNNATLGLYARIVQSPEYRDAKRQTTRTMLPDLLGPDADRLDLSFTDPNGIQHSTADVILVSNNAYELARFVGRGTRARLDRGLLGIATATVKDAADAAHLVTLALAGQVQRFGGWHEWTDERFEIESNGPVAIGVDGEALTMEPPLVFRSLPGVLRVRVPRQRVSRSPAARAVHVLSRSTAVELSRVVAGRLAGEADR